MATSLSDLALTLARAQLQSGVNKTDLAKAAGVSRPTLHHVLEGGDFRVSSLLSLAAKLGLEVVLVSKSLAPSLAAGPAPTRFITQGSMPIATSVGPRTAVEAALARVRTNPGAKK
jgi:DNA-binding XRE family transcriptional regulator